MNIVGDAIAVWNAIAGVVDLVFLLIP